MGLRFDAMSPPREGELAPLESYSARDGAELPVRRYEGDGACATTLLLLHGSGYHSQYLGPPASRIAAAGVARVYTPDLRGHGRAAGSARRHRVCRPARG
jgi:pimeloyl-ACP methyl ester carboxylesterase